MSVFNLNFLPSWKELEYVNKLPYSLTKHSNGYNLKCPICGDSKIKESKKRGWILTDKSPFVYYCFNCGTSISFKNFLKQTNIYLYEEYQKDLKAVLFQPKITKLPKETKQSIKETNISLKFSKLSPKIFSSVTESEIHLEYLKSRKIPDSVISRLVYPKNPISNFLNSNFVIFPFYYKNTDFVYGFQGRSIFNKKFFIYVKEGFSKIYNQFNVDYSKDVYVFESIIDSLYVPNSIAMLGAELSEDFLKTHNKENLIFVFDNDSTGKIKTKKYLQKGFKCFIYPNNIKEKDFNEIVIRNENVNIINNLKDYVSNGKIGLTKTILTQRRIPEKQCYYY